MQPLSIEDFSSLLTRNKLASFIKDNDLLVSASLSELYDVCDDRIFKITLAILSYQDHDPVPRVSYEVAGFLVTNYLPANRFVHEVIAFINQHPDSSIIPLWAYLARSSATNKRFLLNGLKRLVADYPESLSEVFEISVHAETDDLLESELVLLAPFAAYFIDEEVIWQIQAWKELSRIYYLRVSDSSVSLEEFNEQMFFSRVPSFDVWYAYADLSVKKQVEFLSPFRKKSS